MGIKEKKNVKMEQIKNGALQRTLQNFVRAKDVQDKLSHGVLKEVAELPTSMVTVLLEKYLAGAVKFQLKM